jgi:hypothetical protein
MKLTSVISPVSAKSFDTSPIRRMFSSRSAAEKPRFLLSPCRTLSPSRRQEARPRECSACSRVHATVLLPLPLKPVNHTTHPRWPRRVSLASVGTPPSCHLMLVLFST